MSTKLFTKITARKAAREAAAAAKASTKSAAAAQRRALRRHAGTKNAQALARIRRDHPSLFNRPTSTELPECLRHGFALRFLKTRVDEAATHVAVAREAVAALEALRGNGKSRASRVLRAATRERAAHLKSLVRECTRALRAADDAVEAHVDQLRRKGRLPTYK